MRKYIVTTLETMYKTEEIKYEISIPNHILNIEEYIGELLHNNELEKIKSVKTISGEIIDQEITSIKQEL